MNQSINTDSKNSKEPQKKYHLGMVSIKILGGKQLWPQRYRPPPNFYGPRPWGPNYLNIVDVSYVSLSEYYTYGSKRGGEFVYFATRYPCVVKGVGKISQS